MTLTIEKTVDLSTEDVQMLEELRQGLEATGMEAAGDASYAQEVGMCWKCTVCISCRCMVVTFL